MGRVGGRGMQGGGDVGTYVYVWLIHFVIKQKLTHHYKAIILQWRCLKKKSYVKSLETEPALCKALQITNWGRENLLDSLLLYK